MRYRSDNLADMSSLGRTILEKSASLVKPSGVLVYSTCTLNPEENEETVKHFLQENPNFSSLSFSHGDLKSENGMLTLLPHRHFTDGFFMAKLQKKA